MIVTSDRVELIQAASLWGGGSPPPTYPLYTGLSVVFNMAYQLVKTRLVNIIKLLWLQLSTHCILVR